MAAPPPPPRPSKVPKVAIDRAVSALLKWKSQRNQTQKPQLLPSDEFLYIVLTLHKIPSNPRVNAFKIPLPHPLYTTSTSELCLFVPDKLSKLAKSKVEQENLPISEVIKLSKLKKDFKAFEQKRKICDSYDLFFADKGIVPLLPNAIGRAFYRKKKIPVPVELGRENWKEQIERVCSSALLYLSTGTCSVVKVARGSMSAEEIVENVVAAVDGLAEAVPSKWGNVRSFHLKFSESLALPVYQKVPDVGMKIGGMIAESNCIIKNMEEKKKKNESSGSVVGMVKKKKKLRGRIHEVRYMDEEEAMVGEDETGSEGEGVVVEEHEEIVGKKRKKEVQKGEKGLKKKKGVADKLKKSKI